MAARRRLTVRPRAGAARPRAEQRNSPYLDAARAIATQLVDTALPAPVGVTWDGDDLLGATAAEFTVVRKPVGPDLYGGTAGVGWFLGHFAASTDDRGAGGVAVAALQSALAQMQPQPGQSLSLFSGATGVAWAAIDVGERLHHASLRESGLQLAQHVAAAVQRARDAGGEHDLLGGLAGMAIGLLAIHERTRNPQIREAAQAAVARLIEAGRRDAFGMSWSDPQNSTAPALCGLGHGVSGMAWALAEAGWAAGTEAFEPFVHDALRYERGWFSPDHCAWADLREPPGGGSSESFPAWTSAWCHGAFGIGAVRWRLYEKTGDLTALAEATSAIEAARSFVERAGRLLRDGQVSDVTLCHGLGGAIEVMLLGYEVTGERDHLIAARRVGDICLSIHAANAHRWTVGLKNAELVPGLFTGLAGTGVTMLRLHDLGSIASPMLPGRARWTPRLQDVQPIASAST